MTESLDSQHLGERYSAKGLTAANPLHGKRVLAFPADTTVVGEAHVERICGEGLERFTFGIHVKVVAKVAEDLSVSPLRDLDQISFGSDPRCHETILKITH